MVPATGLLDRGSPFVTAGVFYDHGNGQQNRDNESVRGVRLTDKNNVTLAGGGLYVTVGDLEATP